MARGVDTARHLGAISAQRPKGKKVAVFGTEVDVIYPEENPRPSEQILALGGVLISQFPLGTFAHRRIFPIRNRISSGMSVGARRGSRRNIPIPASPPAVPSNFAVSGNVTNKNSWGPNRLIKRVPSWSRPGRRCGKISIQKYDLH